MKTSTVVVSEVDGTVHSIAVDGDSLYWDAVSLKDLEEA